MSRLAAFRIDRLNTVPIRYTVTIHVYEAETEKSLHLYQYDSRVESNCRDYAVRMAEYHGLKPVEVSGLGLPMIRGKKEAS